MAKATVPEVAQEITCGYPPRVYKFSEWVPQPKYNNRRIARRNNPTVWRAVYKADDGSIVCLPEPYATVDPSQPRPMTLAQARAKAKERWGDAGRVLAYMYKSGARKCVVGLYLESIKPLGTGPTFEAAFADADRREAEAKEKMSNG